MKTLLLAIGFIGLTNITRSQSYFTMSLDANSDFRQTSSIGLGMHFQAPIKQSRWHLNWQYTFGGSTDGDFYFRGNALTLLYKSPDYWTYTPDEDHQFGDRLFNLIFCAILPIVCPDGVTGFVPPLHDKLKLGFYCNPFLADYWQSRNKIRSWTIEGGIRGFIKTSPTGIMHLSLGVARIHNMADYENSDYRDGWMLNLSIGAGFSGKEEDTTEPRKF